MILKLENDTLKNVVDAGKLEVEFVRPHGVLDAH
jgi:hypothetical protein